jgi:hypothetical protein
VGGLEAAIAVGATRHAAGLGCLLGAVGGAVLVLTDPRSRLVALPQSGERREEAWWRMALRGTYPSTIGLALLAGIALAFSPILAAVLAGVIGGLGLAGLVTTLALGA